MSKNLHELIRFILDLHKKKSFKEAIIAIEKFEKNNFSNPIILNLKGLSFFFLNKFDNAIKSFNEALDILNKIKTKNNELFISILNNKGMTNLNSGNYTDAITDFNNILKINPNFYQAYNHLGVANENLGKREQSIKYYIKSNNLNENYGPAKTNLIKALTLCKDIVSEENKILVTELKLKDNNFNYDPKKQIDQKNIFSTLQKANYLIQKNLGLISSRDTQTYRRGNRNLNCGRHKKIFNERKIIPKFCFGCFKIVIELKSLIELIKLHILFDNYFFKNGNPRKCMIEARKNIKGIYKGYIYCNSLDEAENISFDILNSIKININSDINFQIKRGCTEYLDIYPEYKNLKNLMNYNEEWIIHEQEIEKKYPNLKTNDFERSTKSGVSLRDILTIRNWIYFAYLKNDKSYELVSDNLFKNDFIKNILDNN